MSNLWLQINLTWTRKGPSQLIVDIIKDIIGHLVHQMKIIENRVVTTEKRKGIAITADHAQTAIQHRAIVKAEMMRDAIFAMIQIQDAMIFQ
jgi:hypothetical protein